MRRNLAPFDRLVRIALAAILLFAAVVLYQHPVARILAFVGGLFALAEGLSAACPLAAHLGAKGVKDRLDEKALLLIGVVGTQMVLAYEWWSAGWEKVSSPGFVQGIGGTLARFASENPFPWYKDFLLGFASENATVFAQAVQWSQVAIGLTLAAAGAAYVFLKDAESRHNALAVSAIALFGGMLMNANFYLAAGWTGPGTHGINVVMFWTQAILIYVWLSMLMARTKA
ncbi:DUF2892 domain-containing protein [Patescibacteria group bacterium]|nr:MAG: DUF2892 domain-containing protein [Patescibacteria group bacterium]